MGVDRVCALTACHVVGDAAGDRRIPVRAVGRFHVPVRLGAACHAGGTDRRRLLRCA